MTLADILIFFTGSDREPPLGFLLSPTLEFTHNTPLANASTCSLIIRLPTSNSATYDAFKEKMIMSFLGHGGFHVI